MGMAVGVPFGGPLMTMAFSDPPEVADGSQAADHPPPATAAAKPKAADDCRPLLLSMCDTLKRLFVH